MKYIVSLPTIELQDCFQLSAFLCRFVEILKQLKGEIIFVTGIGTGIGKTVVSAILTEALQADYWKPVQSGLDETTDTETIRSLTTKSKCGYWKEAFSLQTPASPHLSARIDNVHVSVEEIVESFRKQHREDQTVVIEGAGGLMVPLNEHEFYPDLITALQAKVVVVSNQYLGNINHSLLTAEVLKAKKLPVLGWVFNGTYRAIESDIVRWSRIPRIGRVETEESANKAMVKRYANALKPALEKLLK